MRPLLAAGFAIMLLAAPTSALAQGARQVGNWRILDGRAGAGCNISLNNRAAVSSEREATVLVLTFLASRQDLALIMASDGWSFTTGQRYDILFRFDGGTALVFNLEARHEPPRLALEDAYWRTLLDRFEDASTLEILYRGRALAKFALEGGSQAVAILRACEARNKNPDRIAPAQPAQPTLKPTPRSPPPPSRKSDPFAD